MWSIRRLKYGVTVPRERVWSKPSFHLAKKRQPRIRPMIESDENHFKDGRRFRDTIARNIG